MKIEDYKQIWFENGKTCYYRDAIQVSENIVFVLKGNLWAIVNHEGNQVSGFKYLKPFCTGLKENGKNRSDLLIEVRDKQGKYGAINCCGREVVTCRYDSCEIVDHHHVIVSIKNGNSLKMGAVNYMEEEIIPIRFTDVVFAGCGGFLVKDGSLWGMINFKGDIVIPIKYIKLSIATADSSYFGIDEKTGDYHFLDKNGKLLKYGRLE